MRSIRRVKADRGVSSAEFLIVMGLMVVLVVYLVLFSQQVSELDRQNKAGDFLANKKSETVPFVITDAAGNVHLRTDLVIPVLEGTVLQAYTTIQGNNNTTMILFVRLDPTQCPSGGFSANANSEIPDCGGVDCCIRLVNGVTSPCSHTDQDVQDLLATSTNCFQGNPAVSMMSIVGAGWVQNGEMKLINTTDQTKADPTPFIIGSNYGDIFNAWNAPADRIPGRQDYSCNLPFEEPGASSLFLKM